MIFTKTFWHSLSLGESNLKFSATSKISSKHLYDNNDFKSNLSWIEIQSSSVIFVSWLCFYIKTRKYLVFLILDEPQNALQIYMRPFVQQIWSSSSISFTAVLAFFLVKTANGIKTASRDVCFSQIHSMEHARIFFSSLLLWKKADESLERWSFDEKFLEFVFSRETLCFCFDSLPKTSWDCWCLFFHTLRGQFLSQIHQKKDIYFKIYKNIRSH